MAEAALCAGGAGSGVGLPQVPRQRPSREGPRCRFTTCVCIRRWRPAWAAWPQPSRGILQPRPRFRNLGRNVG